MYKILLSLLLLSGLLLADNATYKRAVFKRIGSRGGYSSKYKKDNIKIIALRIQFQKYDDPMAEGDGTFILTPTLPENVPHDKAYFERYLFHLNTYMKAASYNKHKLSYEVSSKVYTLSHTLGFYGDNSDQARGLAYLVKDAITAADKDIDFSKYDGVLIFHAGIGEETDGNFSVPMDTPNDIASALVTLDMLRYYLANNSSSYKGIFVDGIYIDKAMVLPENETQNYDPSREYDAPFGMLGIMANIYLHFLGVPDLITDQSTSGGSPTWAGTGLWDVMGLGSWDGSKNSDYHAPYGGYGFVPCSPCAWVRKYMDWADVDTVNANMLVNLPSSRIASKIGAGKFVLIPMKDREYLLIENRIQDPNRNGRFDYGDSLKTGKFDFMKDTYDNAEWDFFTPGYGKGSGLLVWHINEVGLDEAIKENSVNRDRNFPHVYLLPADGTETTIYLDNPNDVTDAFWKANNPVLPATGWPSSMAFDGGLTHIWIRSISNPRDTMSFSFIRDWTMRGYPIKAPAPAFGSGVGVNYNGQGLIFQGTSDGKIFALTKDGTLWRNNLWREDLGKPLSSLILIPMNNEYFIAGAWYKNGRSYISYAYPENPRRSIEVYLEGEPNAILALDNGIVVTSGTNGKTAYLIIYSARENKYLTKIYHDGTSGPICKGYHKGNSGVFWSYVRDGRINIPFINISSLREEGFSSINDTSVPQAIYSWDRTGHNDDALLISRNKKINTILPDGSVFETREFQDFNGPAIPCDLNSDGNAEIIRSGNGCIYLFNQNCTIVEEWPMSSSHYPNHKGYSTCPLAYSPQDIDKPYIIMPYQGLNCFAINSKRESLFGFPLELQEGTKDVFFLDIDNDGNAELFCPGTEYWTLFKLPYRYSEERLPWQAYASDFMRSGRLSRASSGNRGTYSGLLDKDRTYVYPNPARDYTIIRVQANIDCNIDLQIFDVSGNRIGNGSLKGIKGLPSEYFFKLDKVYSGVYIIRVKATQGDSVETKLIKLVVQRRS